MDEFKRWAENQRKMDSQKKKDWHKWQKRAKKEWLNWCYHILMNIDGRF